MRTHERTMQVMKGAAIYILWVALGYLLVMSLVGCSQAPTRPDEPEIIVHNATGDEQVEAEAIWQEVKACYPWGGRLHSYVVEVVDSPPVAQCRSDSVFIAGCVANFPERVVVERSYFAAALRHEFVHVIDYRRGEAPDYHHCSEVWSRCSPVPTDPACSVPRR